MKLTKKQTLPKFKSFRDQQNGKVIFPQVKKKPPDQQKRKTKTQKNAK